MRRRFSSTVWWMASALMALAGVATLLMVGHILTDAGMRFFMGAPLAGTLEIATHYYLVPMTFLPLAMVELKREHIVVEAFTHFLPDRWNEWLDIVVRVVCLAVLLLFIWRTGVEAWQRTERGEFVSTVYYNLPIWPIRWVLPVSLGVFALAMMLNFFKSPVEAEDSAARAFAAKEI